MDSSNELTEDEPLESILDREAKLLAELASAEGWVLQKKKIVQEEEEKSENTRNIYWSKDALQSAENHVESLKFKLQLCRLNRNDANTVAINTGNFPPGYGEALGQALVKNTMVTTLQLTASSFLPVAWRPQVFPHVQPMLNFLSTSMSLVDVKVNLDPNRPFWYNPLSRTPPDLVSRVADLMVESICSSKSITKFCMGPPMSPLPFSSLLAQSKSLQELEVMLPDHRPTREGNEAIVQGLGANDVLRRLKLWMQNDYLGDGEDYNVRDDNDDDNDDEEFRRYEPMPTHVLKHLDLVPSLRELELTMAEDEIDGGMFGIFTELDQYLRKADMLRRLTIGQFLIREALMEKLLSGLGQDRFGVQRVAVEELSFDYCWFDVRSSELLLEFMQTPTVDENGATVCKSALRKLCVAIVCWTEAQGADDPLTDEQTQAGWERLAESLLVPMDASSSDVMRTVGSQIEELYIIDVDPHFIRHLSNNANRCRLKRLGCYGSVPDNFSEFLPKIGTVTELILKGDRNMPSTRLSAIAAALKYNGSITAVSAGPTAFNPWHAAAFLEAHAFSKAQLRFVQAYTDRNKFLGLAFGPASAPDSNQGGGHDDDDPDSSDTSLSNSTSAIQVDALQYPSILQSAMTLPASRVWQILVKCGKQCGPGQHIASNEPVESEQATSVVE